jgi:tol-pal system protein YbgF
VTARTSVTLVILLLAATSAYADDSELLSRMSVQQRLERVERLVGSDVLMEQSRQLDQLKQEVASLREQLEQLSYEFDLIKQRQRSLYQDMDRRINDLEGGAGSGGGRVSAPAPVAPPTMSGKVGPAAAATSDADDKDGKQQYTAAFDLLKEGSYKPSITAFEDFLRNFPQSRYADNAQYWLGEANYVSREYKTALDEFQKLIARYPDSSKIAGARLKIGFTYFELKNWSAARDELQQVIKLYPDSTVAAKAQERLDRMRREGN